MRVITLSFISPTDPTKFKKQQLTWNELFATPNFSKTITCVGKTVDINYVNQILLIESNDDVDIFMALDAAPLVGVYVNTRGKFCFKGAVSLNLGMLVLASYIKIDGALMTPGFIGLNTNKDANGAIVIKKKIMAKSIGMMTNKIENDSYIFADQGLIYCNEFTQNEGSCLTIGDPITFKHSTKHLPDANSNALALWNKVTTQPTVKYLVQEIRYIHADKLINKSVLKLRDTELHIKDLLDHEIRSKTTYNNVRIFNTGITRVAESAIIDGKNTFLQSDQAVDVDGDLKINTLSVVTKDLNVNGVLDGGTKLEMQVAGYTTCHGNITAEHAHIVSNQILVTLIHKKLDSVFGLFYKGGISGTQTLRIHSLATVIAGGGYLYSPALYLRSGVFANFAGIIYQFNPIEKTIFSFDLGITLPCAPNSRSDLVNPEKLLRLASRILGSSFPVLQGAAMLGSLAKQAGIVALDVATAVYNDPSKQVQKVVDNAAYIAKVVPEGIAAAGTGVINAGKDFYKEPTTQVANAASAATSALSKVSESWNKMRMMDWLDFILAAHDLYIYTDMIATRGTNCLVFAHELKICLQNPDAAIEKLKNNLNMLLNDVSSAITSPNFASNLGNVLKTELNNVIAAPIKAVQKMASQLESIGTTLSNPEKAVNDLVQNATYALNTIDPARAANDIATKWGTKANSIANLGNNIISPIAADNSPPMAITAAEQSCLREALLDVAMIFGPSVDRRSILSVNAGVTIAGSVMEESLLSSNNGVTIAIGTSTNVMFGYHNSGGVYSYYRTESVGHRYNTGDVYSNTMHLEAVNNHERGNFQVSKKLIFDIKNDFHLDTKANISFPKNTSGSVLGDFTGYGHMRLSGGKISANNYTVGAGANHVIEEGASFYANDANIQGSFTATTHAKTNFKNATIKQGAHYTNHNVLHQGDVLTFEGGANCDLANDTIHVTKVDDQGANVKAENHATIAKEITRNGQWQYKGFLHEDTDFINTAATSSLKKVENAPGVYVWHAKNSDLHGNEYHSRVLAAIDDMTPDDLADYALGAGKYAGSTVTDGIYIYSKTTETITYPGDRANGARVYISTAGKIKLPAKFTRASDLLFDSYAEVDIFVRTVYDHYKLPPPPPIKRKWYQKCWSTVAEAFGVAAAAFAGGGLNPVTMAASAVCSAAAYSANKADKHYNRKESRELEKRQLEELLLQQKSSDAALVLQAQHALAQLENEEYYEVVNNALQQFSANANTIINAAPSTAIIERKQNFLQEIAQQRIVANANYDKHMSDVAYLHARRRDAISKQGGPVIGVGAAVQVGSTGVSAYATITAGNPGQTKTGRFLLTSYDFNKGVDRSAYSEKFPRILPTITDINEDETEIEMSSLPFSDAIIRNYEEETLLHNTDTIESKKTKISPINSSESTFTKVDVNTAPIESTPSSQNNVVRHDKKSTMEKIADFWKDLDDGMQATEYYERPSGSIREIKTLGGTAVGALKAAVVVPFQLTMQALAAAEEFDSVFNPEMLSENHNNDRQRLLYKYQAQHDSIRNGFSQFKYAISHPIQTGFAGAYHFGKMTFDLANTPEEQAFEAGMRLGEFAMTSKYMFFSAQTAAIIAKRGVYNSAALTIRQVDKHYEYRAPVIRNKEGKLQPQVFLRPKGKYLEPTMQLEGYGKNDFLSDFDFRNPVLLTWEQRDIVAYYMYHRFQFAKALQDVDTENFKYLKAKEKLSRAISQVHDHMQPKDLCAYLKEKNGVVIFGRDGKRAKHDIEYKDAKNSMKNIQNLKHTKPTELERTTLNKAKPILAEAWDLYEELRETHKLDNKKRIKLKDIQ